MEGDAVSLARHFVRNCSQPPATYHGPVGDLFPDFLVISPPKTGSSWLAANLRCHADLFVPSIKEVRYFSSFCKWLDLDWYLSHFRSAAARIKGEASPSYAILPVERIQWIRRLMPNVKLIFLMRDPIARAWSHAKHNYRYREANFLGCTDVFETVTDGQWGDNFCHDWPLASGDYLGQLRRWLSVFPREQLYVGFYESIASRPQALLREILAFLGVATDVDFSGFRLEEKILPGLPAALPTTLRDHLHRLLDDRTRELVSFLREHYHLHPPPEWDMPRNLTDQTGQPRSRHGVVTRSFQPEVFRRELDDRTISRIVGQEEKFPAGPRLVKEHHGYEIVFYQERFYALDQALGDVRLEEMSSAEIQTYQERGGCFIGAPLAAVKAWIEDHVLARV